MLFEAIGVSCRKERNKERFVYENDSTLFTILELDLKYIIFQMALLKIYISQIKTLLIEYVRLEGIRWRFFSSGLQSAVSFVTSYPQIVLPLNDSFQVRMAACNVQTVHKVPNGNIKKQSSSHSFFSLLFLMVFCRQLNIRK